MFSEKQREKSIPPLMDLPNRKQAFYKSYKSKYQHGHQFEMNNYSAAPNHGYFKQSQIQNHTLKWKKNHHFKGNCRSTSHPYRKINTPNRKLKKSAEDAEEEERKKKLNDTAKKLLNKIKTWNAEKSVEELTEPKEKCPQTNMEQLSSECSVVMQSEDKNNTKQRIAHSKKSKLGKSRTVKRLNQSLKMSAKYDVNKATVKDFQSRIQHKLIEEIMQMPKESLQSVLNDPKINPIMGLKMSRLVKENRPLITQKLRALAESKMKSLGFISSPQLLVDIDKLIDPVIETDLSVLPDELIKQMENLFQVHFDRSENSDSGQQQGGILDDLQNITFKEDLSLYECSTDEDEEIVSNDCTFFGENLVIPSVQHSQTACEDDSDSKKKLIESLGSENCTMETSVTSSPKENQMESVTTALPKEPMPTLLPSAIKLFSTVCCQTDSDCHTDASTQTSQQVDLLYGVPLPVESKCDSASSLLEEVNAIQRLTNKLNERRMRIFLELFKSNPEGDFVSDHRTKENLAETLSNGSVCLVDSLRKFFRNYSKKNQKNLQFKGRHKPSSTLVNKGKSKRGGNS